MSITVHPTEIPDLRLITTARHGDGRGFLSETYSKRLFEQAGVATEFVQENHSWSARAGTVRGLHFQTAPAAQEKLVRAVRGAVFDVVVDLRRSSPSYGRHVALELSAQAGTQLFVPAGVAHGFCTLEPDTEVVYKVSAYYSPAHEQGVAWDDPALGIEWPVEAGQAILSDRDRRHPRLSDLPVFFA